MMNDFYFGGLKSTDFRAESMAEKMEREKV
jgi:hypothetical protein